MKGMKTEFFCLYACKSDHVIYSYRVTGDVEEQVTDMPQSKRKSVKHRDSFDDADAKDAEK